MAEPVASHRGSDPGDAVGEWQVDAADPDAYRTWFQGIARGEPEAFEALFRAMYDRLCAFAKSYVGSREAAEEVVEDVFLRLWSERERIQVRGSVRTYVYVAVRNRALGYLSHRKVERRYVEQVQQSAHWERATPKDQIEMRVQAAEVTAKVREAIDTLPERTRQACVLYYQHQLSYAEIAQAMGISVKTVEKQLARSLKLLWMRLKDVLGDEPGRVRNA